jgi:Tfp pilus assembly protein PilV
MNNKGFSIPEAVVSVAIFGLIVTGFTGISLYFRVQRDSSDQSRAVLLAEEGLEVVHNIQDEDYANFPSDGDHYLEVSGNQWNFSLTEEVIDVFTRMISVLSIDGNTKEVVSQVSWQEDSGKNRDVSLTTRFTNWQALVSATCSWNAGVNKLSFLDLPAGQSGIKVQTSGNYAYMIRTNSDPNLFVINVTDIANPVIEATSTLIGDPVNIFINGDYAYIASSDNGQELQIVNITDPTSPSFEGSYNAVGNANANGIYVVNQVAYFTRNSSNGDELFIMDVTTPATPSLIGSLNLSAGANEIIVIDNYAYVASEHNNQELQVVDVSTPSIPSLAGSYNPSGNNNGLSITGFQQTVILGRVGGEITLFNISTPSLPVVLGSYNAGGSVNDLALSDDNNYFFAGTENGPEELQVIDISDPASPVRSGGYNTDNQMIGVAFNADKCVAFGLTQSASEEIIIFNPQ